MELDKAILQLYPDVDLFLNGDVRLEDIGSGAFIARWLRSEPQPTQAELNQAWLDWQAGANDRAWIVIRAEQTEKLRKSDWTQISDVPMTEQKRSDWQIYRQSLRDVPQDFVNPGDVVWPMEPTP